mmetsp:Transcript_75572/g.118137  ORF Transcript_75572/g.118137 Transcript_75572/m.118137 type:complete len:881 (-) Transcript_75572:117-2759(-)
MSFLSHAGATAAGLLQSRDVRAGVELASATGGGAAMWLWNWNRAYYSFDVKQRWARFTFINKMACTQTSQFREDIEDLCEQTSARTDNFHIIGVMALTIATAFACPGRLGLHTPPPPSWLMGLFHLNTAGAYLWLFLTMWLAMHASLRADSAAVHMLTRMVRVPVPSQKQLDRARKLFHSWEFQPASELFRIPFFQRHAYKGVARNGKFADPEKHAEELKTIHARTRCDFDVPAWFRMEREVDEGRTVESLMPRNARGSAPEHFEVFRVIQCQIWPYDVYARICTFLAQMHLLSAWGYYQLGHTIQETRAIWAALAVCFCLFTAQQALLTLDIVTSKSSLGFPFQHIGPFGYFFAYIATVLEYKRWYDDAGLYLSGVFGILAHLCVIIYTASLLFLCAPSDSPIEAQESPGQAWWPNHWKLPAAWTHAVWLVAPPKALGEGEYDITDDLRISSVTRRNMQVPAQVVPNDDKKRDVHNALGWKNESPAWFFVRTGLIGLLLAWFFLLGGYVFDLLNEGTKHPMLINAPGLPNNLRDPRYRPVKPGYECTQGPKGAECLGQEVGTGGYYAGPIHEQIIKQIESGLENDDGEHRRLTSKLAASIRELVPYLKHAIRDGEDSNHFPFGIKQPGANQNALEASSFKVEWPALFEPRFLACSPEAHAVSTMAISRYGRGVMVEAGTGNAPEVSSHLSLDGAAQFGPFHSAHWSNSGLLLATSSGGLLECPNQPTNGRWSCQPLPVEKLPLNLGSEPFEGSFAVMRHHVDASSELFAAVTYPGEQSVAFFRFKEGRAGAQWLAAGETRTPSKVASISFEQGSVLMLFADGGVARMRLSDGAMTAVAAAFEGPMHTWQATCGLPNGRAARLGERPSGATSWESSLLFE